MNCARIGKVYIFFSFTVIAQEVVNLHYNDYCLTFWLDYSAFSRCTRWINANSTHYKTLLTFRITDCQPQRPSHIRSKDLYLFIFSLSFILCFCISTANLSVYFGWVIQLYFGFLKKKKTFWFWNISLQFSRTSILKYRYWDTSAAVVCFDRVHSSGITGSRRFVW